MSQGKQITSAILLLLATLVPALLHAAESLVLGVHPYKSPKKLVEVYQPLVNYLSGHTGIPLRLEIARDYQSHIEHIGKDKIDIAYLGPASYVEMVQRYGVKPLLVRQSIHGKPVFHGVIIVRKNSSIKTLSELRGRKFAFGDPSSTMSHLVPRYMLYKAGIELSALSAYRYLGSHDNVALSVLTGDMDAGAVKEAMFTKYRNQGLRALALTPEISEHLFVTSTKLDQTTRDRLRNTLLAMHSDRSARDILQKIKTGLDAYVPVNDSDYDNLREILKVVGQEKTK